MTPQVQNRTTFTRDPGRPELHEDDCPRAGIINDGDTFGTPCTCPETICPCGCHEQAAPGAALILASDDCCDWADR